MRTPGVAGKDDARKGADLGGIAGAVADLTVGMLGRNTGVRVPGRAST